MSQRQGDVAAAGRALRRGPLSSPRSRLRRPMVAAGLGAAVGLALSGCGGSGVHAQASPVTSPLPSAAATQSAEQKAGAAAVAQVMAYERLLDDLSLNPRLPLDRLYNVATQPDVTDEIASLLKFRADHDQQHGRVVVTSTRVDRVDLVPNSARSGQERPTVQVVACIDVSNVRVLDRHGMSLVVRGRPRYQRTHLAVVNIRFPDETGWRISKVTDTEQSTCTA